ncbi:hypothetical protein [Myxococcus stipitatus]|uniref:hypothetical protein n=1 Tax=Myxococcus stipitatus TaxID=83455 RepID=UPI0005C782C7|nr:hypothetical protein [Myxococcus stipitatus]
MITAHPVIRADDDPTATSRLMLPDLAMASAMREYWGRELDQELDLGGLGGQGFLIPEGTGLDPEAPTPLRGEGV